MQKKNAFLFAASLAILFLAPLSRAAPYTFTKIAETTDGYSNLTKPSVNSGGTVAFGATLAGGGHLYTSTGGAATAVYNQTITSPSINDSGQISFISQNNAYRLTGPTLTAIADQFTVNSLYATTMANSGKVYITGNTSSIEDKFLVGDGGALAPVDGGLGLIFHAGAPAVSSNGHYAITSASHDDPGRASVDNGTGSDVQTNFGLPFTVQNYPVQGQSFTTNIKDFGDPDVNADGTVVVSADWNTNMVGIYRSKNGVIKVVALGRAIPAINNSGLIAALFTTGTKSIKVGLDAPTDTVISVGDAFMGSTITNLSFSHEGFSDGNYLAFSATLADGRQGIYLTAVPEPALLGLIAPAMMLLYRTKRIVP